MQSVRTYLGFLSGTGYRRMVWWLWLPGLALILTCGCSAILPEAQKTAKSPWKSYAEAKAAFNVIVPQHTRTADLKVLGFDPASPNMKMLTYLDIIQRFLPNESVRKKDLDKAVRECIDARENAYALELQLKQYKGKRQGDLFLDFFGFKRTTHETGWEFSALLLIHNDTVVYKLASGVESVDRTDKKVNPLGPLQELDPFVGRVSSIR